MAISEFEIKRIEKIVGEFIEKKRPEPHIRDKLDIAFRINGQSFEVYEIRPQWDNPAIKIEGPIAKATYVKSKKIWKLYWMRGNLKWYSYEPLAQSKSLEKILDEIDTDPYCCFWG